MSLLNHYIGLLGCLLVMIAAPLMYFRQPNFSWRVITPIATAMIILAVLPVNGLIIAAYIRAVVSDLSVTSLILLTLYIASTYTANNLVQDKDRNLLYIAILICAVVIYPFGLGLSPWDSYATGYGDPWLYALLCVTAMWLYIKQRLFILAVLLSGIAAYLVSLLASQNLWDYLIDPWLVSVAILHTMRRKVRVKPVLVDTT